MADHQHVGGAPVPATSPATSVERPHVPDEASEEGWEGDAPPDEAPPAPAPTHAELATPPAVVGAGAIPAAVAAGIASPTAPWWGSEALRWARNGGVVVLAFVGGLYLASPAGMALLGHTPVTSEQVAKELRPVVVEELEKAHTQWVATAERERALRDREREAKDKASQDAIDRLAEEQRYQRGILETLRDRRR